MNEEWANLVNPLPTEVGVNVTNQTRTSRNLVYEITQAMEGVKHSHTVTDGTQLHGQGKSNLCGLFGINSGLRHALKQLTVEKTGIQVKHGLNTKWKVVEGGRTAQQTFNDNSKWMRAHNVCSFPSMLSSLIAQVIPRSLEGLDGDAFLQSLIKKQATDLERAVQKLTKRTLFETEGWKRIFGCVKFMESFELDPEHFELLAEKVIHPNTRGFDRFLEDIYDDIECAASQQLKDRKFNENLRNYFVSIQDIMSFLHKHSF